MISSQHSSSSVITIIFSGALLWFVKSVKLSFKTSHLYYYSQCLGLWQRQGLGGWEVFTFIKCTAKCRNHQRLCLISPGASQWVTHRSKVIGLCGRWKLEFAEIAERAVAVVTCFWTEGCNTYSALWQEDRAIWSRAWGQLLRLLHLSETCGTA